MSLMGVVRGRLGVKDMPGRLGVPSGWFVHGSHMVRIRERSADGSKMLTHLYLSERIRS